MLTFEAQSCLVVFLYLFFTLEGYIRNDITVEQFKFLRLLSTSIFFTTWRQCSRLTLSWHVFGKLLAIFTLNLLLIRVSILIIDLLIL